MSNAKYEPPRWTPGKGMYEARKIDPERCRATVHEPGRGCRIYQCHAKAKHPTDPGGTPEWCGTHNPARIRAKREAADAKYWSQASRADRAHLIRDLAAQACDALLDGQVALAQSIAARRALLVKEHSQD